MARFGTFLTYCPPISIVLVTVVYTYLLLPVSFVIDYYNIFYVNSLLNYRVVGHSSLISIDRDIIFLIIKAPAKLR